MLGVEGYTFSVPGRIDVRVLLTERKKQCSRHVCLSVPSYHKEEDRADQRGDCASHKRVCFFTLAMFSFHNGYVHGKFQSEEKLSFVVLFSVENMPEHCDNINYLKKDKLELLG